MPLLLSPWQLLCGLPETPPCQWDVHAWRHYAARDVMPRRRAVRAAHGAFQGVLAHSDCTQLWPIYQVGGTTEISRVIYTCSTGYRAIQKTSRCCAFIVPANLSKYFFTLAPTTMLDICWNASFEGKFLPESDMQHVHFILFLLISILIMAWFLFYAFLVCIMAYIVILWNLTGLREYYYLFPTNTKQFWSLL